MSTDCPYMHVMYWALSQFHNLCSMKSPWETFQNFIDKLKLSTLHCRILIQNMANSEEFHWTVLSNTHLKTGKSACLLFRG